MADIANVIQELIKTCRDGEKGYREAADHAKSSDLKSQFLRISSERASFANELANSIPQTDRTEGHVVGAIHRAWIDVKEALGGGDHAILAWLEQGDDYAKGKYQDALKETMPPTLQALVRRQVDILMRDHDPIRSQRDSYKAA